MNAEVLANGSALRPLFALIDFIVSGRTMLYHLMSQSEFDQPAGRRAFDRA